MADRDELVEQVLSILRTGEHDVTWSRYGTVEEAIADLEHLRDRVAAGDDAARGELELRFAPTGSVEEIAISSGWAETWLELVKKCGQAARASSESRCEPPPLAESWPHAENP